MIKQNNVFKCINLVWIVLDENKQKAVHKLLNTKPEYNNLITGINILAMQVAEYEKQRRIKVKVKDLNF